MTNLELCTLVGSNYRTVSSLVPMTADMVDMSKTADTTIIADLAATKDLANMKAIRDMTDLVTTAI